MKKLFIVLSLCSTQAFAQTEHSTASKTVRVEIGHRHYWSKRSYVRLVSTSVKTMPSPADTTKIDQANNAVNQEKYTATELSFRPRHYWRRGGAIF